MKDKAITALPVTPELLEKMNRYTLRAHTAEEVYAFRVILCDNDVDRDMERFTTRTLQGLSRLYPGKTGLFDHSMKSTDQHARIFEAWVEELPGEKTRTGEPYHQLRAMAYLPRTKENETLIREIDAGIKKEVSVGCSVERTSCSICGADFKRAPCSHVPGKTYGGALCHKLLDGAADAYEWSFVAVPAQPRAGVTKQFRLEEQSMQSIRKTLEQAQDGLTLSPQQAEQLRKELHTLDRQAAAGRAYQEDLRREVCALCALELPGMDAGTFAALSDSLSVEELKSFRRAFLRKSGSLPRGSQLETGRTEPDRANDDFKI